MGQAAASDHAPRSLTVCFAWLLLLPALPRSYVDLVESHLLSSFLSRLPAKMSHWIDGANPEAQMLERPDTANSFVVFTVLEDIEAYQAVESVHQQQRQRMQQVRLHGMDDAHSCSRLCALLQR